MGIGQHQVGGDSGPIGSPAPHFDVEDSSGQQSGVDVQEVVESGVEKSLQVGGPEDAHFGQCTPAQPEALPGSAHPLPD